MPARLDRCVKKLQAQRRDKKSAWAICMASVMGKRRKGKKKKPSPLLAVFKRERKKKHG